MCCDCCPLLVRWSPQRCCLAKVPVKYHALPTTSTFIVPVRVTKQTPANCVVTQKPVAMQEFSAATLSHVTAVHWQILVMYQVASMTQDSVSTSCTSGGSWMHKHQLPSQALWLVGCHWYYCWLTVQSVLGSLSGWCSRGACRPSRTSLSILEPPPMIWKTMLSAQSHMTVALALSHPPLVSSHIHLCPPCVKWWYATPHALQRKFLSVMGHVSWVMCLQALAFAVFSSNIGLVCSTLLARALHFCLLGHAHAEDGYAIIPVWL